MKKALTLTIVALICAAALFASPSAEKAASGTKQTVTVWHSAQGSNKDVFEDIARTFNETVGKEKGIIIDAVYQGKANDVLTKVKAALGTDTLADIAMMDATAATDMNGSDELVTIDRLGIDVSGILPCGISSYSSEKGLLALPFNASALLFYYNKSVYDKAGVGAPSTLDEFAAIAPKTAGEGRTAFTGVPATFELSTFIGAQNGVSYMVDNRNGHDGGATKTLFDTEGTYKAFLEKWKKLFDTGVCSPVSSGVTAEFTSGRTAAMLASSSNLALVLNTVDGSFEVGVARVPAVNEKATGGTVISGGALFAFTASDAVKTVLEYLVSPEVQALWSEKTGYVPVSMAAYETESYKAFLEKNPLYKVASDALMDSDPGLANVWVPSAYSIYYSFQANIVDVVNGKNIDEAVKEMAAIVNSEIAAFRKQNN